MTRAATPAVRGDDSLVPPVTRPASPLDRRSSCSRHTLPDQEVHSAQLLSPGATKINGVPGLVEPTRTESADVVVEPTGDAGEGDPRPSPDWAKAR